MEEIKSILESIKSRVSNELVNSYVISFFISNYKIFIIIFSSGVDYKDKFRDLNFYVFPNYFEVAKVFGVPLIMVGFYLFFYPVLSRWVFQLTHDLKVKYKKAVLAAEGKEIFSKEEVDRVETRYKKVIEEIEHENYKLKQKQKEDVTEYENLSERLTDRINSLNEIKDNLNEKEKQLKKLSLKYDDLVSQNTIVKASLSQMEVLNTEYESFKIKVAHNDAVRGAKYAFLFQRFKLAKKVSSLRKKREISLVQEVDQLERRLATYDEIVKDYRYSVQSLEIQQDRNSKLLGYARDKLHKRNINLFNRDFRRTEVITYDELDKLLNGVLPESKTSAEKVLNSISKDKIKET